MHRRARQQQVDGADRRGGDRERAAGDAAERRAAADEAEQPLGLPRVVDEVGERPELADEEHAEDLPGEIERDRHPRCRLWKSTQNTSSMPPMPTCVIGSAQRRGSRAMSQAYPVIRMPMMKPETSRT